MRDFMGCDCERGENSQLNAAKERCRDERAIERPVAGGCSSNVTLRLKSMKLTPPKTNLSP